MNLITHSSLKLLARCLGHLEESEILAKIEEVRDSGNEIMFHSSSNDLIPPLMTKRECRSGLFHNYLTVGSLEDTILLNGKRKVIKFNSGATIIFKDNKEKMISYDQH